MTTREQRKELWLELAVEEQAAMRTAHARRNKAFAKAYRAGASLREIGELVGLGHEGVRYAIKQHEEGST